MEKIKQITRELKSLRLKCWLGHQASPDLSQAIWLADVLSYGKAAVELMKRTAQCKSAKRHEISYLSFEVAVYCIRTLTAAKSNTYALEVAALKQEALLLHHANAG